MAARRFILDEAQQQAPKRGRKSTRERIEEALLDVMAERGQLNHDVVAERAGVSRRTAYRYFPDREALLGAVWDRLGGSAPAGTGGGALLQDVRFLLDRLEPLFKGFDRRAAVMTVALASPEGRQARLARKGARSESYRTALAQETAHLDEPARTQAVAVVELLTSALAWRGLRDQWELSGEEMASGVRWAVEALLRDLHDGGGPKSD